jgi:beta-lactamase family protein
MSRWTLTGVALLAALVLPAPAASKEPPGRAADWQADYLRAQAYAEQRAGDVSFSLRTGKRHFGFGGQRTVSGRSVIKAMYLVTYLRREDVRRRPLRPRERGLLGPMIRRSSNRAAATVLGLIGQDAVVRLARRARMRRFVPAFPIWGDSITSAADQTRFFLHIEQLLPRGHRDYALRLLATIVPSQRWGIGRVPTPGWQLHFKGGWGSGTGEAEHQVALLRRDDERIALAIMTTGNPSAAYGRRTQRGVAARLLRQIRYPRGG